MSDPAVEAAQRALIGWPQYPPQVATAAAREALKPIRELHEALMSRYADRFSGDALTVKAILDDLAPLIYTSEEFNSYG